MHAAPPLLFPLSRSSCRLQPLLKRRDIKLGKCTDAGSGKSGFHNKYVHNNNKNQKNLHHEQNRAGKERGEPRALGLVTRLHAAPPLLFPLSRSSCRLQTLLKRRDIKCTDAGSGKFSPQETCSFAGSRVCCPRNGHGHCPRLLRDEEKKKPTKKKPTKKNRKKNNNNDNNGRGRWIDGSAGDGPSSRPQPKPADRGYYTRNACCGMGGHEGHAVISSRHHQLSMPPQVTLTTTSRRSKTKTSTPPRTPGHPANTRQAPGTRTALIFLMGSRALLLENDVSDDFFGFYRLGLHG